MKSFRVSAYVSIGIEISLVIYPALCIKDEGG